MTGSYWPRDQSVLKGLPGPKSQVQVSLGVEHLGDLMVEGFWVISTPACVIAHGAYGRSASRRPQPGPGRGALTAANTWPAWRSAGDRWRARTAKARKQARHDRRPNSHARQISMPQRSR